MGYSDDEIAAFAAKDLRITKLAIQKELIRKLDMEDVREPEDTLFELCDKYVKYTYEPIKETNLEDEKEMKISWVQIAEGLSLAIPDATNIKMLDVIVDEYKKAHKASINPSELLSYITTKFGRYPSKQQNVDKVLELYSKR